MKRKKKIKTKYLMFLFIFLISAIGTAAYFTSQRAQRNSIQIGNNEISIVEDFAPPKEMVAGENTYKKNVQVENIGTVPCYVRVFCQFSDSVVRDKSQFDNGSDWVDAETYGDNLPSDWTYISFDEDSVLGGYYYYTKALSNGDKTQELFKRVKTTFTTAEEVQDYQLIIYSESVQTKDKFGQEFTGKEPWKEAWEEYLTRR